MMTGNRHALIQSTAANLARRAIISIAATRYTVDGWFYRQPERTRQTLAELQAVARGKPIIVVGNGPSLNETPLEEFSHLPSIGMNKIDLLYSRTEWRPSLVVCENDLVVRQNRSVFSDSEIPVFLAWKSRWHIGRNENPNLHYFRSRATQAFSKNAGEWVAGLGWTVTYTALQFAYYLGGDPVVLFGVDHRFDSVGSGIAKRTGPDVNHFDPGYFAPGQRWGLPDLTGSEKAYRAARLAFEEDGRQILDATIGGQLQVFTRIDLDEARRILKST